VENVKYPNQSPPPETKKKQKKQKECVEGLINFVCLFGNVGAHGKERK